MAALADVDPVWIERTRIAFMYDGAEVFVRRRDPNATGAATRENTRPLRVVLGNRSGSQGTDTDRDGLSDLAERELGTDPNALDTDGDTIPDSVEIFGTGTSPTLRDTDRDGVDDNAEVVLDDPNTYADDDGDGFPNGQELAAFGTDPESIDSDGDGFSDDLEYFYGTEMNDPAHPTNDADGDGDPDEFEMANGTDPNDAEADGQDTDGDNVPDWLDPDEVMHSSVRGRRRAVAASSTDTGVRSATRAQLLRGVRRRLSPVYLA